MTFANTESSRRIGNILKIGAVTQVNSDGTARVKIGDLLTKPLQVGLVAAGGMQVWWMPTVGEQVLVASPDGDLAQGVIVCSILANNAPSTDTSVPMIDLRQGQMVIKGATLKIEADVEVTGKMTVTEDVYTDSDIIAKGGIASGGGIPDGNTIHSAGDVIAQGISLVNHTHDGVIAGSDNTGPPT